MTQAAGIFRTPWFYHRPVLAPEGQYVTVTEVAEWARAPYDDLRRHLIVRRNGDAEPPAVLMLAPSRHGDGTTTTAIMLGASLATNARCLLLELNFRRPGLADALGLSEYVGLKTVLDNGDLETLERSIVPTAVPNLFALPSQMDGSDRTLPDVRRLGEVVRQLRGQFEHIVIDAAPVIGYPDTSLLAMLADAVMLVVAADSTPVESALAARRELEVSGARLLGAVVTRQRRFVPEFIARRLGAA